MQPLRDAIKKKYGVSDDDADQVISALTEVEKYRQDSTGAQVHGFRARQPGERSAPQQAPDIGTIIGQTTGTRSRQGSSGGIAGMGFVGMIISIFMTILRVILGSRSRQGQGTQGGSGAVTSVLTDLLGGATTPSQAPDLASILGGLLGGNSGTMTGGTAGNQTMDVNDMVQILLNQSGSSGMTRPRGR